MISMALELMKTGISMSTMHTEFRGECSYQAESDVHFPHLTVSQTLTLAAEARAPRNALVGSNCKAFAVNAMDATLGALDLPCR